MKLLKLFVPLILCALINNLDAAQRSSDAKSDEKYEAKDFKNINHASAVYSATIELTQDQADLIQQRQEKLLETLKIDKNPCYDFDKINHLLVYAIINNHKATLTLLISNKELTRYISEIHLCHAIHIAYNKQNVTFLEDVLNNTFIRKNILIDSNVFSYSKLIKTCIKELRAYDLCPRHSILALREAQA